MLLNIISNRESAVVMLWCWFAKKRVSNCICSLNYKFNDTVMTLMGKKKEHKEPQYPQSQCNDSLQNY